ncbi:3856_t:CDS:2, partial [Paraglomus occultum]
SHISSRSVSAKRLPNDSTLNRPVVRLVKTLEDLEDARRDGDINIEEGPLDNGVDGGVADGVADGVVDGVSDANGVDGVIADVGADSGTDSVIGDGEEKINDKDKDDDDVPLLYTCKVVGECTPCNIFETKTQEYCIEFGNKEKLECKYNRPTTNETDLSLLPEFRPCRRVKLLENTRFLKFQHQWQLRVLSTDGANWRQKAIGDLLKE